MVKDFNWCLIYYRCKHYFCEKCALNHYKKSTRCYICNQQTHGVFNPAKELIARMKGEEASSSKQDDLTELPNDSDSDWNAKQDNCTKTEYTTVNKKGIFSQNKLHTTLKLRERKVKTLTRNWRDHKRDRHTQTHGNWIEIFRPALPSSSIKRE